MFSREYYPFVRGMMCGWEGAQDNRDRLTDGFEFEMHKGTCAVLCAAVATRADFKANLIVSRSNEKHKGVEIQQGDRKCTFVFSKPLRSHEVEAVLCDVSHLAISPGLFHSIEQKTYICAICGLSAQPCTI